MLDRLRERLTNLTTLTTTKATVGATPADVVHTENKWRLLHYRARPQGLARRTPVLLVPSLINRHYVLDLMPGKSFTEYLVAQGHDVFAIDWGTPGPEDRFLTFDDICDRYLGRAVRIAARNAPDGRVHLFGYCLGGVLTTIYAAARPEHVASLTAVAAPVRFKDDGMLASWVADPGFDLGALVDACGNIPSSLMQSAFQMLRPTLGLAKVVGLVDRLWDTEFVAGYAALETWATDNVSMPGEFFRRYIDELYRGDALIEGKFTLSGDLVLLRNITCPTLAVTFLHDNIVPWKSAAVLIDEVGSTDKHHLHLPGTHVGSVISRGAAKSLWPQLSTWLAQRDAEPLRRRPVLKARRSG